MEQWKCINKPQVFKSTVLRHIARSAGIVLQGLPNYPHEMTLRVSWGGSIYANQLLHVSCATTWCHKKRHFNSPLFLCHKHASSCDCSLTSWTLARAERRMSDASQSKHAKKTSTVLWPSTSPGPEGQNFCSQSSPIPQAKCSNQMIYTCFWGNFRKVFESHQSMHPKIPEATKHQRRDHPNSGPKYKLERPPATSHPSPSIHPMSGKIERIKHQRTKNQEKVSCIYIYTKKTYIYI